MADNLRNHISEAVAHYWQTRKAQREKQKKRGVSDAGLRSAVTGGAQMDGFIRLFTEIIVGAGLSESYVFKKKRLELPGFFRPTKEWDLIVVKNEQLIAAIESKSQVGPSFGNNFNNRTEKQWEALLISGRHSEKGLLMEVFNRFLAIFSCLKTVRSQRVLIELRNLILRFFLSLPVHHICEGMSYFVGSLFSNGIIHQLRS